MGASENATYQCIASVAPPSLLWPFPRTCAFGLSPDKRCAGARECDEKEGSQVEVIWWWVLAESTTIKCSSSCKTLLTRTIIPRQPPLECTAPPSSFFSPLGELCVEPEACAKTDSDNNECEKEEEPPI